MTLPGKFGVSASGAATYKIPIAVPPGTAGMSPSLTLDYNSQSGGAGGWLGSGLVGVGWSVGGLPAIGRCPRTLAQDGANGAVNYDANDRFCLDGQRLIAITGAYGADGTEYRTEIESFSRIISHGTAGTGPAWFEVHSKSGQVLQFGNTTDSFILAQGKTTARSWAVNKVSDTVGNYYTVTYAYDTVFDQAYPTRIDYTANDGAALAPYNSVRFVYDTYRSDTAQFYHAGSSSWSLYRLKNVQTYAGATLVSDYQLIYTQSLGTQRSELFRVTLCDGSGNCLPATEFTWQNGTTWQYLSYSPTFTPTVITNVAGQDGTLVGSRPYLGDFNGDGLTDIMWDAETANVPDIPNASTGTRVLWTSTGGGNFAVTTNFAGQNGTLSGFTPVVGDFNRDGRSDVRWFGFSGSSTLSNGTAWNWLSTAAGGFSIGTVAVPVGGTSADIGDYNSDNRTDLLWYYLSSVQLAAWLTNPDGSTTNVVLSAMPGAYVTRTVVTRGPVGNWQVTYWASAARSRGADFNGDGNTDLIWLTPGAGMTALWLGNGDGTFSQIAGTDASVDGYIGCYGDFNGDGNTDILWFQPDSYGRSTGRYFIWNSKGDGTFLVSRSLYDSTTAGYVPVLADFNGDGMTDILWYQADTNGLATGTSVAWLANGWLAEGLEFNPSLSVQDSTIVGHAPVLADFNGDGKTDVLWDSHTGTDTRSTGSRVLWLSDGAATDVIATITTGVGVNGSLNGNTTTITYKPLTDGTVYTKESTAVDPIVDVQAAMQVVSRVDVSNGIGGTVSAGYAYVGAKSDLNGRGFLGFRQMNVTDLQTNIVQATTYRQDYPYLNMVASEVQTLGNMTLGTTANTYSSTALGGTRYQTFLSQSQASKTDLDGTALPTATRTFQYDAYGNATQVAVATSDGHSTTTTNTYTNDSTNWLLGRLTASTVTSQTLQQPGQSCTLPWGGTISAGQSVPAYSALNPPVGQSCSTIAQTRACINGTLNGSYTNQSCSALCALPWGGTISSGQSVTAYSAASVPAGQLCSSIAQTRICGDGSLSGSYTFQSCVVGGSAPVRIYLTSGSTWTVPNNWNNTNNKVETIGAGGGGGGGNSSYGAGAGGGGGAYSAITNLALTPGANVTIQVGVGGTGGAGNGNGGAGGDTFFNGATLASSSVGAQGGGGGVSSGGTTAGGAAASGIGTTKYSGGAGGASNLGSAVGGGGGGGAACPSGGGGAGGFSSAMASGGGGGGGANGGFAGGTTDTVTGSNGGSGVGGTGGGAGSGTSATAGDAGSAGGGGGGGYGATIPSMGGGGGSDTAFDATHGCGGGGGGGGGMGSSGSPTGAVGGNYGGGGGGGGWNGITQVGAAGAQGLIVITYTPQ